MTEFEWSKKTLENSISSRCWNYTPYEEGWDECPDLRKDSELKQIIAMEQKLDDIPEWARLLVERDINYVGPCGHYKFPEPQLEIISAIGSQTPPVLAHTCYTVDRERKRQMMDYCLCLDAWLAGAKAEPIAQELTALGYRKIDWMTVCADMWNILGEHEEAKDLLVERMLHLLRHSIKWCIWDDDMATEFGRDQYLGDYSAGTWRYGNPHIRIAGFQEDASPRLKRIQTRLAGINSQVPLDLTEWWLCAPKSFRFLERNLWIIGMRRLPKDGEDIPGFLQCEDTYPNQDAAANWYTSFRKALNGWWRGKLEDGDLANDVNRRLGESTPVKSWLVRLFLRKLRRLEENGEQFTNLVTPGHNNRRGTKPIV